MDSTTAAQAVGKIGSTSASSSENSEFSGTQTGGSHARLRSPKLRRDMEINKNDTEIELPVLTCLRCGHTWHPRRPKLPAHCANCCSPYWNKPRQRLRATPKPTAALGPTHASPCSAPGKAPDAQ